MLKFGDMIVGRCTSSGEIQPEYILIFVRNFSNSLAMPFETVMTASAFFSKCFKKYLQMV